MIQNIWVLGLPEVAGAFLYANGQLLAASQRFPLPPLCLSYPFFPHSGPFQPRQGVVYMIENVWLSTCPPGGGSQVGDIHAHGLFWGSGFLAASRWVREPPSLRGIA